jgi:hypothetical protein
MKSKRSGIAIVRRVGRKKIRVKVGVRVFLFYIGLALLVGTVGIFLELQFAERDGVPGVRKMGR